MVKNHKILSKNYIENQTTSLLQRSFTLIFGILITIFSSQSFAAKKDYKICNHHKFTYLMLKVYDVYLCTNSKDFLAPEEIYKTGFSLIINYDMNFDSEELAKSSIEEINRYYEVSRSDQSQYYDQLLNIFPNVKDGDTIEAKYNKKGFVEFFHNQKLTGIIKDKEFSMIFLDIWLYKDNKYKKMIKNLFN